MQALPKFDQHTKQKCVETFIPFLRYFSPRFKCEYDALIEICDSIDLDDLYIDLSNMWFEEINDSTLWGKYPAFEEEYKRRMQHEKEANDNWWEAYHDARLSMLGV